MKFTFFLFVLLLSVGVRADVVSGRVLGPDGAPLAATVLVVSHNADSTEGAVRAGRSGEDGWFQVNVAAGGGRGSAWRDDTLAVYTPHFGVLMQRLRAGHSHEFRYRGVRAVSGEVRDERGKPAAGVQVGVRYFYVRTGREGEDEPTWFLPVPLKAKFSARSDAQGRWRIGGLPPDSYVEVEITDARYMPNQVQIDPQGSAFGREVRLMAKGAGGCTGRVLSVDGQPISGVRVRALPHNPRSKAPGSFVEYSAVTDSDGRFALRQISTGDYDVAAWPERLSVAPLRVARAVSAVRVTAGATATTHLTMAPAVLVKGRVFDKATQLPVSGALIGAWDAALLPSSPLVERAVSDAQGGFEIPVAPGAAQLFVWQQDCCGNVLGTVGPAVRVRVPIKPGQSTTRDFWIKSQASSLDGRVVDETGTAVGGINLIFWSPDGIGTDVNVDKNGRFHLNAVSHGRKTLSGQGNGATFDLEAPQVFTMPLARGQELLVRVRRLPVDEIAGRVTTPEGANVPDAKVRFQIRRRAAVDGSGSHSTNWEAIAYSDGDGRFSLGPCRLDVTVKLLGVEKNGFALMSGGAVSVHEGGFLVAPIVVASSQSSKANSQNNK